MVDEIMLEHKAHNDGDNTNSPING
eukprot:SAG11_NODE_24632_length_370_cov_1.121771_1_plen_25_part_01